MPDVFSTPAPEKRSARPTPQAPGEMKVAALPESAAPLAASASVPSSKR
jgi:hypothetical protein